MREVASITSLLVFCVCACVCVRMLPEGIGDRRPEPRRTHAHHLPTATKAKDTTPTDLISSCAFAASRAWRDRCKCSPDLGAHTSPACCSSFIYYQPLLSVHSPTLKLSFMSLSLSLVALRTQASLFHHSFLKCE